MFRITYRNMIGRKNSYTVTFMQLVSELSELIECKFRIIRVSRV